MIFDCREKQLVVFVARLKQDRKHNLNGAVGVKHLWLSFIEIDGPQGAIGQQFTLDIFTTLRDDQSTFLIVYIKFFLQ